VLVTPRLGEGVEATPVGMGQNSGADIQDLSGGPCLLQFTVPVGW
jgi:hypothetical protein